MDVRDRVNAGLARQLGHPQGLAGRLVGMALDRRNRRSVTAAVEALPVVPGGVVADVGFGGGVGLALLLGRVGAGCTVEGVEVSSEMLRRASRRFRREIAAGRLRLQAGAMTALPFDAVSLDGIVTTNTVYFVDDLDAAFAEFARVLKPAGRAVIGLGDPDVMAGMSVTPYGFRLRSVSELVAAIERAGLALDDHRRVGRRAQAFHVLVAAPRGAAAA